MPLLAIAERRRQTRARAERGQGRGGLTCRRAWTCGDFHMMREEYYSVVAKEKLKPDSTQLLKPQALSFDPGESDCFLVYSNTLRAILTWFAYVKPQVFFSGIGITSRIKSPGTSLEYGRRTPLGCLSTSTSLQRAEQFGASCYSQLAKSEYLGDSTS